MATNLSGTPGNPAAAAVNASPAASAAAPGAAPSGTAAEPASKRRRNTLLLGLLIVALIAGGIWFVQWWMVGRFIESTDDAYVRADSVTIAPKVSGYVAEVYVRDNETVKAGQPLVKLDVRQYQASLEQSRATIVARQADISRAEADYTQQQAMVAQAQAQAESARINADHAAHEFARFEPLGATGAETNERIAQLRSTRDQARANYAANVAQVRASTAQLKTIQAQIAQARAQLEASAASAKNTQLDLDDTVIRSAIDGRVGDRTVRLGQYAQPGTRLMSIVPVQNVYVVANYKETQVGGMAIGQPVTLHVDALPDATIHGKVESFAPGTGSEFALLPPENATGNFTKIVQRVPVRIHVDTDDATRGRMLPGMSVTTEVDTRGSHHG